MISLTSKIFITGATGFIGSNLLRSLLFCGFKQVHILLRESSNTRRINDIIDKPYIHYGDLNDKESLQKALDFHPDIIYHLAVGGTNVGRGDSPHSDLVLFNLLGTINLLDICIENKFTYFINSGSSSEYGEKDHPMNESDFLAPNNLYGFTKACSTLYCNYIGRTKQLPIYTYRIFGAYGPYEDKDRLLPHLILSYIEDRIPKLSSPYSVRDYIYIDELVDYYLQCDKINQSYGDIFNIGTGLQYTIQEVVNIVKNQINSQKDPLYGVVAKNQIEPALRKADMTKTEKIFSIPNITLSQGIEKSIEWFKEYRSLYL